ncbi:hypothetical protein T439DRAFT_382252 [Meredithblackwellia eburnea MCA 4105]
MASVPDDQLIKLVYVLYNWRNSPLLRKDPLAKNFFQSLTPAGLFDLLHITSPGEGITLWIGKPSSQGAEEIFITATQLQTLTNKLAESQGPTRAQSSFDVQQKLNPARLSSLKPLPLKRKEDLEEKLAELKTKADFRSSEGFARQLEWAREVWKDIKIKGGMAVAMDVETWEIDHDYVTEVGWSWVRFENGKEERGAEHVVIEENQHKRNGKYCPDARYDFSHGTTQHLPVDVLAQKLTTLLTPTPSHPLLLLMHDPKADMEALNLLSIPTTAFYPPPDPIPPTILSTPRVIILDTQTLFSGYTRNKTKRGLKFCCENLGWVAVADEGKKEGWHNAGNDAWWTGWVFEKLVDRRLEEVADTVR